MELQFSIFGFLIMLIFYVLSGAILALIWRLMRRRKDRKFIIAPLALLLLALPWADEVWIAWHFHQLCQDAGIHVVRKVEADGFYDDTGNASRIDINQELSAQAMKANEESGYKFKEIKSRDKVVRIEKLGSQWHKVLLDSPTAQYHYKYLANSQSVGLQLEKTERVVVDTKTNEIIGQQVIYKRYPGWVEGLWERFFGIYPTLCPNPQKGPRQPSFPEVVLSPNMSDK